MISTTFFVTKGNPEKMYVDSEQDITGKHDSVGREHYDTAIRY
jgi:hypothetical protein